MSSRNETLIILARRLQLLISQLKRSSGYECLEGFSEIPYVGYALELRRRRQRLLMALNNF